MFGLRSDGKKVKNLSSIERLEPFFVPQRIDALNLTSIKVSCEAMDDFINKKRKEGDKYNYMYLLICAIVRLLYTKERLNRFAMRGRIYQRNYISISMDVKRKLEEDGDLDTLKFYFSGRESLPEIKKIIEDEINNYFENDNPSPFTSRVNKFAKQSDGILRMKTGFCRWLDKHGMLSKCAIKASPFHTSCFIANLKSIKLGYIYHHLYNFGTSSIFISLGKEKLEAVVDANKEIKAKKMLSLGVSLDERIADGLYMGGALRLLEDFLTNPETLMSSLPDDGTVPKQLVSKTKKAKKIKTRIKKEKVAKEKKPKKIKPLKNKLTHETKLRKSKVKKTKLKNEEN